MAGIVYGRSWSMVLLATLATLATLAITGCGGKSGTKPGSGSGGAGAAGTGAGMLFVPVQTSFAMVVYPRRVLTNSALARPELEELFTKAKSEIGFDVRQVEQILVVGRPGRSAEDTLAGAVIRFSAPFDPQVLLAKTPLQSTKVTHEGKSYTKMMAPMDPCYYQPDDRTLLIGREEILREMMIAEKTTNLVVDELLRAREQRDFFAVFDAKSLRENLPRELQSMPTEASKQLDKILVASVGLQVVPAFGFQVSVEGTNIDTAKELQQSMEDGMVQARNAAPLAAMFLQNQPEGKVALNMLQQLLDKLKLGREGNRITVSADEIGTMKDIADTAVAAVAKTRSAAENMVSMNNFKQIGLAMHMHHDAHNQFPAAGLSLAKPAQLSWRVHLLPFLGEDALYRQFRLDEPWDSARNKPLIARMPKVFAVTGSQAAAQGKTRYLAPVGKGTMFDSPKSARISEVTDGLSRTIMGVVVDEASAVIWTKPDDWQYNPAAPTLGLDRAEGKFMFLLGDGSVNRSSSTISPNKLKAAITKAGNETDGLDDDFPVSFKPSGQPPLIPTAKAPVDSPFPPPPK